jgi:hypothetical protein
LAALCHCSEKRFRIAFSFAGEVREFVAEVAEILALEFGKPKILYDKYHQAEFARRDLGIYLPELYHKKSDLVVVVVCPSYEEGMDRPGMGGHPRSAEATQGR